MNKLLQLKDLLNQASSLYEDIAKDNSDFDINSRIASSFGRIFSELEKCKSDNEFDLSTINLDNYSIDTSLVDYSSTKVCFIQNSCQENWIDIFFPSNDNNFVVIQIINNGILRKTYLKNILDYDNYKYSDWKEALTDYLNNLEV